MPGSMLQPFGDKCPVHPLLPCPSPMRPPSLPSQLMLAGKQVHYFTLLPWHFLGVGGWVPKSTALSGLLLRIFLRSPSRPREVCVRGKEKVCLPSRRFPRFNQLISNELTGPNKLIRLPHVFRFARTLRVPTKQRNFPRCQFHGDC